MTNCVMLCRGRYRLTEQALASLYANTPRYQFSLCLVHDCEGDDFRVFRLLQGYAAYSNCSLVRVENSGHVLARLKNLGVFWSRQTFGQGEWLYLSDCDVAFLPGWLENLIAAATLREPEGKLFGGQIHPFHHPVGGIIDQWSWYAILDGPSWLMRWSTWKDIGGFSRTCAPGPCQSEDAEWCARLVAKGGRIGVIHPHVVVHTGLSQTDGRDAPGRDLREKMIPEGVLAE